MSGGRFLISQQGFLSCQFGQELHKNKSWEVPDRQLCKPSHFYVSEMILPGLQSLHSQFTTVGWHMWLSCNCCVVSDMSSRQPEVEVKHRMNKIKEMMPSTAYPGQQREKANPWAPARPSRACLSTTDHWLALMSVFDNILSRVIESEVQPLLVSETHVACVSETHGNPNVLCLFSGHVLSVKKTCVDFIPACIEF